MDTEFLEQLKQMAEMDITDELSPEYSDAFSINDTVKQSQNTLHNMDTTYQMPAYLKEQIITRTKQADFQVVSTKRKYSKQTELFLYSCKVTAAVAASLAIIITLSITQEQLQNSQYRNNSVTESWEHPVKEDNFSTDEKVAPDQISKKISNHSQSITDWLQDFSGNLFESKK